MRKLSGIAAILLMLALAPVAQALESEDGGKIAVVDPMQAIMEVEEFQEKERELEESLQEQAGRAQALQQELGQLEQRMQREGMTLSEQQRQQLAAEGQAKAQELQQLQQGLQQQAQQQQQAILEAIEPKLIEAIEAIATEKDLDMVINAQAMIYVHPDRELDITEEVIRRLNEGD